MGERVVDGDVGELVAGPTPERAAAGGEHDAAQLGGISAAVGAEALVDRAVLAVDRDQLGARGAPGPLHDRTGGDQRLLVGEREAAAGLERGERHGEPGEADDAVDHDVGLGADGRQGVGAGDELGAVREQRRELRRLRLVGEGHDLGAELGRLLRQRLD